MKSNIKAIAQQRIQEWKGLGMSEKSIINLINGMMMNNTINNDNMLLCLEIKNQLS